MSRRTSALVRDVEYMAPSSIHHIRADSTSARTSIDLRLAEPDLDRTVTELTSSAGGLVQAHHLKIQIVEKDGNWFALNSAQLELCRRLEKGGVCPKVRVDIVPSNEVPVNVRDLMTLPVTRTSGDDKRTSKTTVTQKSAKSSSAASATGGGSTRGYQQLGQEEKETEDADEEEHEGEEEEDVEDKNLSEEEEENAVGDTDDGSSADIASDSDLEWSDEEVDSSEGEWSNIDGYGSGSCSGTAELSSDDENNCLL